MDIVCNTHIHYASTAGPFEPTRQGQNEGRKGQPEEDGEHLQRKINVIDCFETDRELLVVCSTIRTHSTVVSIIVAVLLDSFRSWHAGQKSNFLDTFFFCVHKQKIETKNSPTTHSFLPSGAGEGALNAVPSKDKGDEKALIPVLCCRFPL